MNCKPKKLDEHESRKNAKLKEEFDDIDLENYDDHIEEFDFENASHASKASYLELNSFKFTLLMASFTLRIYFYQMFSDN